MVIVDGGSDRKAAVEIENYHHCPLAKKDADCSPIVSNVYSPQMLESKDASA